MLSEQDINEGYQALLRRPPESDDVVKLQQATGSLQNFLGGLVSSWEFQMRERPGPLWNYVASFDPVSTVLAHDNPERRPVSGHRVNYLGAAVNVDEFCPQLMLENIVEPPPIPNNWHTDIAELAAALRAVEFSDSSFSMIELGCGWGCWMNITGAAARRLGKTVQLLGVEGDPGHVAFAHEAMATNGFGPSDYKVFHGIAAASSGLAFFPRQTASGQEWGLQPKLNPTKPEAEALRNGGRHQELPVYSLEEIAAGKSRIDLLHIDIQGGEFDLIRDSINFLRRRVAYMVVGTHSRKLDGDVLDYLAGAGGWALEIERPAIFTLDDGRPTLRIDGVQGWRNLQI